MKFKLKKSLFMLIIIILTVFSCSTIKEQIKLPEAAQKIKPKENDYLEKDVVLARFIWEDFYEASFFPAKILTEASEKTKDEYEVVSLTGSPDVSEGATIWTKDVILESHPAKEEELKVGIVILYTGDETAKNDEDLKNSRWNRGVILNIDELYKEIVSIKGGIYRTAYDIHIRNIRISDVPFIEPPTE